MRFPLSAIVLALIFGAVPAGAADFGNWAAVVVAGDWRAHDGGQSPVFDDARRDLVADLERIGFRPQNIAQLSAQADHLGDPSLRKSSAHEMATALWDLSQGAPGGCLLYITSHGSPDGVRVGDDIVSPTDLAIMVNNACGHNPAVVIVSACFSGIFIPAISAADRLVITAARPDRTSFGCSTKAKYTYFDNCVLSAFPASHDFPDLAASAKQCVAREEQDTGMSPPSDPQVFVGTQVAAELPAW